MRRRRWCSRKRRSRVSQPPLLFSSLFSLSFHLFSFLFLLWWGVDAYVCVLFTPRRYFSILLLLLLFFLCEFVPVCAILFRSICCVRVLLAPVGVGTRGRGCAAV